MRGFAKTFGALCFTVVDLDETDGPVCCEVPKCSGMALERVTMAGYPAGFLCTHHAHKWLKLWRECIAEEDAPMELAV